MVEFLTSLITEWHPLLQTIAYIGILALVVLVRYFIFTSVAYGLGELVGWLSPSRRLQDSPFTGQQIRREIINSMVSVVIFTIAGFLIVTLYSAGWTQLYTDPDQYGAVWFWLQIPAALMIHDWYFYWMHRTVHHPKLYGRVHHTHHLSRNPTAFAAFAFHPIEAVLEVAIVVIITTVLPMHGVGLTLYVLISLAYNVYGHLGYEIMPRWIAKSALGKFLNTSAYHNQHHKTFRYNFGIYTTIWDRLHGTMHPQADDYFDRATVKPVEMKSNV